MATEYVMCIHSTAVEPAAILFDPSIHIFLIAIDILPLITFLHVYIPLL